MDPMMQLLMLHPDLDQFSFSDAMGARPLSSEDASSLASLLNEAFEDGAWTSEQVHEKLLNASDILQVYGVVEHGAVVATASARQDESSFPGQGYVHMVATGLAARGRGLGRAVTEA